MGQIGQAWQIEFHSGIPVYKQIIHFVQAAIAAGTLKEGDQLPTIRALHRQLDVNPNTVARAYRELAHLGLVATAHGSGCYVTAPPVEPPALPAASRQAKVIELSARVAAEARSHGISLEQLIRQLHLQKNHV
ncbi:GntR family transcriptional regulator [Actomonas aquatica]|uniref:GntR family transcriptional regulator n=1 Tax=Actomonas aquatica TaxID=2866162 RepID=A0ABZ1C2D5_9BACT|nr:GntR family transcriptional regulator [Opitutus sp. WL0086]WRQ85611.1 GntR family transcriptional regulator [Opitutus sp. WL0086]